MYCIFPTETAAVAAQWLVSSLKNESLIFNATLWVSFFNLNQNHQIHKYSEYSCDINCEVTNICHTSSFKVEQQWISFGMLMLGYHLLLLLQDHWLTKLELIYGCILNGDKYLTLRNCPTWYWQCESHASFWKNLWQILNISCNLYMGKTKGSDFRLGLRSQVW